MHEREVMLVTPDILPSRPCALPVQLLLEGPLLSTQAQQHNLIGAHALKPNLHVLKYKLMHIQLCGCARPSYVC
jgi:hypothetical protein